VVFELLFARRLAVEARATFELLGDHPSRSAQELAAAIRAIPGSTIRGLPGPPTGRNRVFRLPGCGPDHEGARVIGIRREDKNRWERRVPPTPDHIAELTRRCRSWSSVAARVRDDAFRALRSPAISRAALIFGSEIPPQASSWMAYASCTS
jgi:hypothetical protein